MMMNRQQVFAELQQIFQDVFVDDTIVLRPEMTANDIEKWDSMQQINIIMACEEAFGIRFKPREINALENVGEMVDQIVAGLKAAGRA
jgi:acyl carrier protein